MINNKKLNSFISSITDSAKKQADALNSETDTSITKKLADFEAKEKTKYNNYLISEKQVIDTQITKSTAMLKLEKKRLLFEKRNAVTKNVFDRVESNLDIFRKSDDYPKVIGSILSMVKKRFPDNSMIVVLSENDKGLSYELQDHFNCEIIFDDKISGGALIKLKDSNICVDYTFNSLINDEKEKFLTTRELRILL